MCNAEFWFSLTEWSPFRRISLSLACRPTRTETTEEVAHTIGIRPQGSKPVSLVKPML
jgi:hypothetical protein